MDMKTKLRYFNQILFGASIFLTTVLCTACSEDVVDTENTSNGKPTSLTFRIDGIEDMTITRASNVSGADIFSKYVVKLYLFAEKQGEGGTTTNPYPNAKLVRGPILVDKPTVTITDLDMDTYNYCYVIVACEEAYENYMEVKEFDVDGYDYSGPLEELDEESLYTNCCIPVLDETNMAPYGKEAKAEDYFMVYGFGGTSSAYTGEVDFIQPVSVVLRRQMGAVVFNVGDINNEATCSVFTEFYRLYLSQMVESSNTQAGTRNHAHNGAVTGTDDEESQVPEDPHRPYSSGDYAGFCISNQSFTQNFTKGTVIGGGTSGEEQVTGYVMYLPCTTVRTKDIPAQENANVNFGGTEEVAKTTITTNGKTYSTSTSFPIYPNRRTILTANDGGQLTVSFSGEGGGINYEDDWNGGVVK